MQRLAILVTALLAAGSLGAQTMAAPTPANGAMAPGAKEATTTRFATGTEVAVGMKAKVAAAPSPYRSPFVDYQRWREPEPVAWRGANDEAAAIGGPIGQHGGHATNAPPAPAAASGAPGKPMRDHTGHAMGSMAPPSGGMPAAASPVMERAK
jgi:hypothetical protein